MMKDSIKIKRTHLHGRPRHLEACQLTVPSSSSETKRTANMRMAATAAAASCEQSAFHLLQRLLSVAVITINYSLRVLGLYMIDGRLKRLRG